MPSPAPGEGTVAFEGRPRRRGAECACRHWDNGPVSSPVPTPARPAQATLAAWMIMLGSVFVLLSTFEVLNGLGSLKTREAAERFLDEARLPDMSVQTMLEVMHGAAVVTAVCAAGTAVLGWFVLRRDKGARIGITVLAVPLFAAGSFFGGFATALVAVSAVFLWLEPTRSWFAGRPLPEPGQGSAATLWGGSRPPQPPAAPQWPQQPPQPPHVPPAGAPGVRLPDPGAPTGARPYQGFGQPSAPARGDWVAPVAPGWAPTGDPAALGRPMAVVAAALVTWLFATLMLMGSVGLAVFALSDPERLFDLVVEQDPRVAEQLEPAMIRPMGGMFAAMALLCLAAIVSGVGLMLRKKWGAVGLLTASMITAGGALLGTFANPPMLLFVIPAVVVIGLLRRPDVRRWVLTAPGPPGARPGQPPHPGQPHGHPYRPQPPYPPQQYPTHQPQPPAAGDDGTAAPAPRDPTTEDPERPDASEVSDAGRHSGDDARPR